MMLPLLVYALGYLPNRLPHRYNGIWCVLVALHTIPSAWYNSISHLRWQPGNARRLRSGTPGGVLVSTGIVGGMVSEPRPLNRVPTGTNDN